MHPAFSRPRGVTVMTLLGTASFLTIAGTVAAQAQGTPPVEEVLVTGSLIRGATAVGVPVTALSDQDFRETGALTISDMLKSVPSAVVQVGNPVNESGGQALHNQNVAIHGLSSATASETLLLIDGVRFPPQGVGFCVTDPSIIPQLAVDHIDVLADGASAIYGSDAVAGVINVVLKHGFDGAISQVQYGRSTDIGGANYQAAQVYGRKWDSGDVTVSYEWDQTNAVAGPARDYFTTNFEPYGFDNKTPIGASMPGVVSTGSLSTSANPGGFSAKSGTRFCANCYSVPVGTGWNYGDTPAHTNPTTPGSAPTTSWTTLLANAGVTNEKNPADYADILPPQDRNMATITFDQNVMPGISVFAEAFYSNRRSPITYTPGASPAKEQALTGVPVSTANPYYPAGAPAGLRISYDLGVEHDSRMNSYEVSDHYEFGVNADLPYDWHGKLYYAMSGDYSSEHITGMVNLNMVSAALGNTVPAQPASGSTPGQAAFTKPANIPYLNVFCDATKFQCNSPATLAYIGAFRDYNNHWQIGESGLNLDGPVFDLPGGPLRAAVGFNTFSNHSNVGQLLNFSTVNTSVLGVVVDPIKSTNWATYGELNVPLVGDANKMEFIQALSIEASLRYDRYDTFGGVSTPKIGANWTVGWGLTLRGDYGKSFRAPIPAEVSPFNGATIQPLNQPAGGAAGDFSLACLAIPGHPGGVANPGSLNFALNPTCAAATAEPGGITAGGGSGVSAALRLSDVLSPEKAVNWNLGADFRPTDFLQGLDLSLTWYNLKVNNSINNNGTGVVNGNDPLGKVCTAPGAGCDFFIKANPGLPISDPANAEFLALVTGVLTNPKSVVSSDLISNVQFIQDSAQANLGFQQVSGLDFSARYDFDLGDWGAWNTGLTANYPMLNKSQSPGLPTINAFVGDTGGRLKYRGRLGWAGTGGWTNGLSVTGFVNFIPHSANVSEINNIAAPPPCYWATGFSAGSCYPGSPFIGPFTSFPNEAPGLYTFDLALGYTTGTQPANAYLQNLNFELTVNDIFNKAPPFEYNFGSGRSAAAFVTEINPLQRFISVAVTKSW